MGRRHVVLGAALVASLLIIGCSDPTTGQVSGQVTVGGKPLEKGTIQFVPADGTSPTAGGEVLGGKYSVRVSVGTMKVSFSAPKVVGQKKVYNTPDSPTMPVTAEALPARYSTESKLTLEVKPGSNPKDWELEEK
jgi:hypothetical protein